MDQLSIVLSRSCARIWFFCEHPPAHLTNIALVILALLSILLLHDLLSDAAAFIAADLNLYSNPLNRALGHKRNAVPSKSTPPATKPAQGKKPAITNKSPNSKNAISKTPTPTKGEMKRKPSQMDGIVDTADTMIACDLNKYDSPMKELETKYE